MSKIKIATTDNEISEALKELSKKRKIKRKEIAKLKEVIDKNSDYCIKCHHLSTEISFLRKNNEELKDKIKTLEKQCDKCNYKEVLLVLQKAFGG